MDDIVSIIMELRRGDRAQIENKARGCWEKGSQREHKGGQSSEIDLFKNRSQNSRQISEFEVWMMCCEKILLFP